MQSLTKDNFWNAMQDQHPALMDVFSRWIDEYKVRVEWKGLFSCYPWSNRSNRPVTAEDYKTHERSEITVHQYKYHDLPLAMQVGIFIQFTMEQQRIIQLPINTMTSMADFKTAIEKWFAGQSNKGEGEIAL